MVVVMLFIVRHYIMAKLQSMTLNNLLSFS